MKFIEELTNKFKDSVNYLPLNEILNYEQPGKYIVNSTNYDDDYDTPVLTAGSTFILGYTNEKEGIYLASKENPVIIFDDFTTSFHWVDFPFKVKSSAMKMLKPYENIEVNFRFVYYAMKSINYTPGEHARQWIDKYSKLSIPIPSIEVQCEIVQILDKFTLLTAELTAELTARKQQYEYYKEQLLSFSNDEQCECYKLKDIVEFKNGKGHEKIITEDGKYIVVNSKFISTEGAVKKYCDAQISPAKENDILIVMSDLPNGRALAKCFFVDSNDKYTVNQRIGCLTIMKEHIDPKFLFYQLNRNSQYLKFDNGVDQTNLRKEDVLDIDIYIPKYDKQLSIVEKLDNFSKYFNVLNEGLPGEIELRNIQYEYYRNKLLSLDEN